MHYDYTAHVEEKQEVNMGDVLRDESYSWREQKLKTYRLSGLYLEAGLEKRAQAVINCCEYMSFGITQGGQRKLIRATFCKDRLCPVCSSRKARNMARDLSRILDVVENEHPDVRYVFLTLTMRNCSGDALVEEIKHLTKAWYKLIKHRDFERAVHGWFRSIEITRKHRNPADLKYHPHIHAVLAVDADYFKLSKSLYLSHEWFVQHWQKALGVDYEPSVHIEKTKVSAEKLAEYKARGKSKEYATALEAAKYPIKDADYISTNLPKKEAVTAVKEYAVAMKGRRFTAYGGWFKEIARRLKLEEPDSMEDLTDIHDQTLRDDIVILIQRYQWSFGAKDYILEETRESPEILKLREKTQESTEKFRKPPETEDFAPEDAGVSEAEQRPEQLELPGLGEPRHAYKHPGD